jgi:glycosyltransferase involved in cell wall biosynthesis
LTIYDSNINFIKSSLESVFSQTYSNTEIIIIDNGTKGNTNLLIENYFTVHHNSKLIQTTQNEFDPHKDDLNDPIINLWNAGLFSSFGDYVYFLSYDDILSTNYVQKMISLFELNPNCCTASPLIQSINSAGEINIDISNVFKNKNSRDRYTNGIALALSYMKNEGKILFPGGLLAVKSDLVLELGGFDNMSDLSQLFKFGIHGDSGFDNEAILYWRHHDLQTNLLQKKMGLVYYRNCVSFIRNYEIYDLHMKLGGIEFLRIFKKWYKKFTFQFSTNSVRDSLKFGMKPFIKAIFKLKEENAPLHYFIFIVLSIPSDLSVIVFYKYLYPSLKFIKKNLIT